MIKTLRQTMTGSTVAVASVLTLIASGTAQAEVIQSRNFLGDISRITLPAQSDGTPMAQVFVSVSTLQGAMPVQAQYAAAAEFAAGAGCRNGKALTTILSGRGANSVDFEVLCQGRK